MKRPILIAVSAGVLAFLFTALYLSSIETKYKAGAQMVKVLVAKDYINQGSTIDSTMVEEKQVPKEYLQPKAMQSAKEIINSEGRSMYISVVPIEKGEQVMTTKLSMLGIETGIASIVPNGKRAFIQTFNSNQVAGIVKPGNSVDIIAVMDSVQKEGGRQQISKTILQNVMVLSVGKDILGVVRKEDQQKSGSKESFMPDIGMGGSVAVALALSPQEAELLTLAAENGKIAIALRSIGDTDIFEGGEAKLQNISKNMVSAVKPVDPANPGIDIQKQQKEAMELLKKYKR